MAAADATAFGVKGQALRVYGCIKDSTTGNPLDISGAVTMSCVWSLDGTANATVPTTSTSAAGTITKVTSHTGHFYVDIIAAYNDYYHISMTISSNAANSVSCTFDITNVDLSEKTGHWRAQTVKRIEDMWAAVAQYIQNKVTQENNTNTITVRNYGDTANLWTQTDTNVDNTEIKGQAS